MPVNKAGRVGGRNRQISISLTGEDCLNYVEAVGGDNIQKSNTTGSSINIAGDVSEDNEQRAFGRENSSNRAGNVEGDNKQTAESKKNAEGDGSPQSTTGTSINIAGDASEDNEQRAFGRENSSNTVGNVGGANDQTDGSKENAEGDGSPQRSDADHNRQCEHAADPQQPQMMSGTVNVPVEANRQNVSAGAPLANENQDHPLSQMGQDENLSGDEAGDGEGFRGNADDSHQRQDVVNPQHVQEVGDAANGDSDVNRQTTPVANGSQDHEAIQIEEEEADEGGVKDWRTDQRQTFYGLLYALVSPFFYLKKKIVSFVIQWWSAD